MFASTGRVLSSGIVKWIDSSLSLWIRYSEGTRFRIRSVSSVPFITVWNMSSFAEVYHVMEINRLHWSLRVSFRYFCSLQKLLWHNKKSCITLCRWVSNTFFPSRLTSPQKNTPFTFLPYEFQKHFNVVSSLLKFRKIMFYESATTRWVY